MTRTPSSIFSMTFSGVQLSRNAIPFALQASRTRVRASTNRGSSGFERSRLMPKDMCISPGPHSPKAIPGTVSVCSTFESARTDSIFTPSSSSPSGLSGHGSAFSTYSSAESPHTGAAVACEPVPRVPCSTPQPIPNLLIGKRQDSTNARTASGVSAVQRIIPCVPRARI
jgi:hypothetical protein